MSRALPQYRDAIAFEQSLGDPACGDHPLSYRRAIDQDERDEFPEAAIGQLHALGLYKRYVPLELGGRFASSEEFIALGRTVARRNMSVAVSYSTLLWSVLVWIGGTLRQQQEVAHLILRCAEFPCLAYSEASHGADLTANTSSAVGDAASGYLLNGEKWPINRGTRSGLVVLLARSAAAAHQRNQSLFIIDKRQLDANHYYHLPRVKTHGLRGCDISGIGFKGCRIPAHTLIGKEGLGLELALKGFQVTRTFCSALSLGVGDTCLRLVTDFALQRQLYGAAVIELPHTSDVLANAYVSQLVAEACAIVAARGLHLFPRQYSAWSSIVKVQVAHAVDHASQQLAHVLGARYYMREQHQQGMFQKMLRDGAIVAVFDGSSIICLDSLATLLPTLASARMRQPEADDCGALFDLRCPLPPLPFEQLDVFGRGRDAVIESLPALVGKLSVLRPDQTCTAETLQNLRARARELLRRQAELDAEIRVEPPQRGVRNSAQQFQRAERYCDLHAASSCLGLWLYNREHLDAFFAAGIWLDAVLQRQQATRFCSGELDASQTRALLQQLRHQHAHHHMFSLLEWPLAGGHRSAPTQEQPAHHDQILSV